MANIKQKLLPKNPQVKGEDIENISAEINEDVDNNEVPTSEKSNENQPSIPTATITQAAIETKPSEIKIDTSIIKATSRKPQKMVSIKTVDDHSCIVGGVRYNFKGNVPQNVPQSVKFVLSKAGKLRG